MQTDIRIAEAPSTLSLEGVDGLGKLAQQRHQKPLFTGDSNGEESFEANSNNTRHTVLAFSRIPEIGRIENAMFSCLFRSFPPRRSGHDAS
jgi:hypothetical protein